ncbi:ATP-binding protein [Dongia deserti]|uniref:ATP-binding protein n=1 Tax=Dongia deserti TaxID=2268030 RepID=UPI000E6555D7|nr:ATP-binding protein [Dongia deserti]
MTGSAEIRVGAAEVRIGGRLLIVLILVMLAGLPLVVWLDIDTMSRNRLSRQAEDLNAMITGIRGYYADNVVGRILEARAAGHGGNTEIAHNYETIPGAIPLPFTLSLELGRAIGERQKNITYRYISDQPFKNRPPHPMDEFERSALARLRAAPDQAVTDIQRSGFSNTYRLVVPVIMKSACVTCHNSHPESLKTDWKVGDVRGIQEMIITQPFAGTIFSFKYLLIYFFLVAATGSVLVFVQHRQARLIRRYNSELAAAAERAMAASEAKSNFLANMSHELRTPLNAIIGFSEMMARQLIGPLGSKRYVEYASDISGSAQHLLKIINDILDFSKIEAGEMRLQEGVVDLSKVLNFCRRLVQRRAAEGGLILRGSVSADVPRVRADELKIKQVLLNLLSNAVKFTPSGGLISVDTAVQNGDLILTISDTGIGMAPEQVGHALEPFGQIDNSLTRAHDGTGLGLPLARALVELHDGTLAIDSALGQGTKVTITLPAERLIRT